MGFFVSTWWSLAPRTDLGISSAALAGGWTRPFAITNAGWYLLHKLIKSTGNAHTAHLMAEPEAFVPTRIAIQWGNSIQNLAVGDWFLVSKYNGHAVVPAGIVHARQAESVSIHHELTPLDSTGLYVWLLQIGSELSIAPSGYLISGKPRKGSNMSQSITKGEKVNLGKASADAGVSGELTKIRLGLGWDVRQGDGPEADLDAVVIACNGAGKAVSDDWRIFFNNKTSPNNAISHGGDNLTGAGDGDDETVTVDLAALPAEVESLEIYVTLYDAATRGLNFGLVNNAFVRILDDASGTELCRFDLSEDAGANASVHFAKVYRNDGTWAFKALGQAQKVELDGVFAAH